MKDALEEAGFALPEPIYRLRFDADAPAILKGVAGATVSEQEGEEKVAKAEKPLQKKADQSADVSPDTHITEKVEEERRENAEDDLLTDDTPVE
ncbi:MAG: hypothetical protein AAF936_16765 [Pseudomonadota bacterium]